MHSEKPLFFLSSSAHFFLFAFCYYYYYFVSLRCVRLSLIFRQGVGHSALPVNLPSFAFHMPRPPHSALLSSPPSLSICLARAISACLIHNLRGRSERAQRTALCDLCTQVRSQSASPPPLSTILPLPPPTLLLPMPVHL